MTRDQIVSLNGVGAMPVVPPWTHEPPAVPGGYWIRSVKHDRPARVANVREFPAGSGKMVVEEMGFWPRGYERAGPLPEAEEPF